MLPACHILLLPTVPWDCILLPPVAFLRDTFPKGFCSRDRDQEEEKMKQEIAKCFVVSGGMRMAMN